MLNKEAWFVILESFSKCYAVAGLGGIVIEKYKTKKASNFFEAFETWVADRVRTGDPRHHKPIL